MYLYRIGEKKIEEWKSLGARSQSYGDFLSLLQKGEAEVYYTLTPEGEIVYEAFPKEGEGYASVSVNREKEAKDASGASLQGASLALAVYIAEKDNSSTLEELKARYGADYDSLSEYALLSLEEAASLREAENQLSSLKSGLLEDIPVHPILLKRLSFRYAFSAIDAGQINVSLAAGRSIKLNPISNLDPFLNAYLQGKEAALGAEKVDFATEALDEQDAAALEYFARRHFCRYTYDILLKEEDFPGLIALLLGKKVLWMEEPYDVALHPEDASVKVLGEGKYELFPAPSEGARIFLGGKIGALVEKQGKKITLLQFRTTQLGKFYAFLVNHPHFPFAAFSKEVDGILSLAPGISFSPEYVASHPQENPYVTYSIGYTSQDGLLCHSVFHLYGKEVSQEEFSKGSSLAKRKYQYFLEAVNGLGLEVNGTIYEQNRIVNFLQSDLTPLDKGCQLLLAANLKNRKLLPPPKIAVSASAGEDWFQLSLTAEGYSQEELKKILDAYKKKRRFVFLNGKFVSLSSLSGTPVGELVEKDYNPAQFGVKLPLYEALKLNDHDQVGLSVGEGVKKLIEDLSRYKKENLVGVQLSIRRCLRPYQADAVRWMKTLAKHRLGGILADEMGLGKTLETIAFLSTLEEKDPILIVAPKSLLYNWKAEFAKWDPNRKVVVLDGPAEERWDKISSLGGKQVAAIVSYDSLRNDLPYYQGKHFAAIILDEAQSIANASAKKSRAVKELESDIRFVLTGTPIQNSLLDLWSIFDFLLPGYLPGYSAFKEEYGTLTFADDAHRKALEAKVSPFILKREKKDVLTDLPPKEETEVRLAMNDEQRAVYESYLALARGTLQDETGKQTGKIEVLAALTRLRQICVDPTLFLDGDIPSEKTEYLLEAIHSLLEHGHKCLVFSSFAKELVKFQARLKEAGIDSGRIDGQTPAEERLALAQRFNEDPEFKVMLVSLKAGGTGLNLIGADSVFLLDPWWNLAAEEQASDRAHRIGQTRKVTVFKLVCTDSVEEKVLLLQAKKKDLSSILEGKGEAMLTDEDLAYLLS